MLIVLRQNPDDSLQVISPLCLRHLRLGAGPRIRMSLYHARVPCSPLGQRLIREPLLQCEIVANAKEPTPKVLARATQLKVSEQSQEYLLRDLFRIVD